MKFLFPSRGPIQNCILVFNFPTKSQVDNANANDSDSVVTKSLWGWSQHNHSITKDVQFFTLRIKTWLNNSSKPRNFFYNFLTFVANFVCRDLSIRQFLHIFNVRSRWFRHDICQKILCDRSFRIKHFTQKCVNHDKSKFATKQRKLVKLLVKLHTS